MDNKTFNNIVKQYESTVDSDGSNINIHYLALYQNNKTLVHSFNGYNGPSDIRSISKTVMTMIMGIVKEKSRLGKFEQFDEESYVYPIIKDVIDIRNPKTKENFKKIKVKYLLTHTVGYDKVLLMRDDIKDMDPYLFLDYIVNSEIKHTPGDYYLYSNAGFYLMGVVLQTLVNMDLFEFIDKHFFKVLEFEDYHWEKYGDYLASATRLWLRPEDLIKIGILLLDDGVYNNIQVVPKTWIEYMKTPTVLTPGVDTVDNTFRRYSYAKGMWLAKDHNINFGHGTDGQIVAVIPEKNIVVATLAHQHDLTQLESILNDFIETIDSSSQ